MFWDEEYIDEKLEELKDMIETNYFEKDKSNNFIAYDDLEDTFSHNEISDAQKMFMDRARVYLSNNYPGEYAIWCDWCVHITTVNFYKKIMLSNNYREDYRKMRESREIII